MKRTNLGSHAIVLLLVVLLAGLGACAGPNVTDVDNLYAHGWAKVAAPTNVGTATPALVVQNAGASNAVEVRNSGGTPVFYVDGDGSATYTGFSSGGGVVNESAKIVAPTAVGTATPAFAVDSTGVSNLFEARKAATPVFVVGNTGPVTVGNDGAGVDVTFYSGTAGDKLLWDASEEALVLTGTNGQTALSVADGNLLVADNAAIDGTLAVTGTVTLGAAPVYAGGAGAIVADKATVVETGDGYIHKTVLTLTLTGDNDLDLADGDHGTGVKIYDFPEGRILVMGAVADIDMATTGINADPNDTYYVALGSATGADDADLTSTEADIIAKITADGADTATANGQLAASAQFDGTTTPLDLYFNVACADANNSGASTYAATGTVTITWINLGDY